MATIKQDFFKDRKNRCIYEIEYDNFEIIIRAEILFFDDGTCEVRIYEDNEIEIVEDAKNYFEARGLIESYTNYEVELLDKEEVEKNCLKKEE